MRKCYHLAEMDLFQNLFQGKKGLFFLVFVIGALTGLGGCGKTDDEATAPPAQSSPARTDNKYELGSVISFGTGGGSERFRQDGWSTTEGQYTWAIGNSSKLVLSIPASAQPFTLRMRLTGFTNPPTLTEQPVEVFANGQKIADWTVAATADFTTVIPAAIVKDGGALTIEIKTPKAASPKALGMSEDARVLGVLCSEFAITQGG